jgi:pSer/pThr/pTyr-binding forkhead associated (FHA) protein
VESPNYVGPQRLAITHFPFTIGRSRCDLSLKDTQISRQHLKILAEGEQVFVMDMDSRNGTLFDGKPLNAGKKQLLTKGRHTLLMGHHTTVEFIIEHK